MLLIYGILSSIPDSFSIDDETRYINFIFSLVVRAANNLVSRINAHTETVCGLKWSERGNLLASGGNDNLMYIWEPSKMSSSNYLYCFKGHRAAVKAMAWCPYQSHILASGGGTTDGYIKLWNTQKGNCISSLSTKAQASHNN